MRAGKSVVNSISLKEGEADFLAKARTIRDYGAGAVVMASTRRPGRHGLARKVDICQRAYKLLVDRPRDPSDIISIPTGWRIATGLEEHNGYAVNFISVAHHQGDVPRREDQRGNRNLSFSFRGNDHVREPFISAFLFPAIKAGLDMGIVTRASVVGTPTSTRSCSSTSKTSLQPPPDATERMMELPPA